MSGEMAFYIARGSSDRRRLAPFHPQQGYNIQVPSNFPGSLVKGCKATFKGLFRGAGSHIDPVRTLSPGIHQANF